MCSLWQNNYIKKRGETEIPDREKLKIVYKKLSAYGIKRITYIGGEPFLKDYIINTAEDSINYNIIPSVVTNGTLLNNSTINYIVEKNIFETIIFSIDGSSKIHNKIRGRNVFELVYNNIKLIRKLKNQKRLKKPKIFIYITLWDENYLDLENAIEILLKLNPNKIRIQLASSITKEIIEETNKIIPQAITTHSYINSIETKNAFISIREKAKSITERYKIIEFEKIFLESNKVCHFINKDFIITPSGNILICPMLTGVIIGNIYRDDPEDIFKKNSTLIKSLEQLSRSLKLPVCRECCVEKITF